MFRLKKISPLLIATLLMSHAFYAQHPSFESTLKTYKPWAITLSGGGNGLMFGNQPWDVNTGSILQPPVSTNTITGTWTPTNKLGWLAGLGGLYVFEDPILIDRVSFNLIGGKRQITEEFSGIYVNQNSNTLTPIDTVLNTSRSAINIGAALTAFHTFTISPDLFIESGLGLSYKRDFLAQTMLDSAGYMYPGEPQIQTFSLEATIGVGVMVWKGRFLRLNFSTDLLQFIKNESPNNRNGAACIPWMMNDYRPYRVLLNYDIHFKRKGGKNCANPTHSEKARELFGEDMRKHRKVKNNKKKKKKRRRDIY
jgi:hypothetical protein